MRGFGGVISFEIEGDLDATSAFIDAVSIPLIASSFGGVETLIEQPALMSYYGLVGKRRHQDRDNLVRLSVGVETRDLIGILENLDLKIEIRGASVTE
jgi:cystathionine gamma-synthase